MTVTKEVARILLKKLFHLRKKQAHRSAKREQRRTRVWKYESGLQNQSLPKKKHLLTLWHYKILLKKVFHPRNKQTHRLCQEGMKENKSMAVRI
jgi:hypothetical protein